MPKEQKKDKGQKKAASKTRAVPAAASDSSKRKKDPRRVAKYLAAIVIIVIIIGVAIFATLIRPPKQPSTSFEIFKKNYDSAPRVNIFVAAYNGTVLSSTIGCATAIIEKIIASPTNHRDASTIDLNIINQTSCIRSTGLGNVSSNYTTTSLQNCLNTSSTEPSIFINYSSTNTTIIRPDYMYVSGDELFLRECGLASELG